MSDVNHVISDFRRLCLSNSVNFVPPEGVGECILPSTEYGRLPHNHSCKEGKLQVKEMDLDGTSQGVEHLNAVNNTSTSPSAPASVPGERPNFEDMRRELEWKKFIVETKGHLFDPCTRANLLREIPILIEKINSFVGPSSPSSPSSSSGSNTTIFSD